MADIMRKTRASYHYAVRHIKRMERELRKSKMAESVSTNKQRDIWVETKKMLSGKKPSINSVDGACNPEAISQVFASKYHRCQHGLRKMRESARNDISRTHTNFARAHKCEQNTTYPYNTKHFLKVRLLTP